MRIVIATNNQHKVEEYKKLISNSNIEFLSLSEANIISDEPETGNTLEENSMIKAMAVSKLTALPVIADDSGLFIESMPGELGVHSARFYENLHYIDRCKIILDTIKNKSRVAYFKTVITLIYSGNVYTFTGICNGTIANTISGSHGFGYDPIFIPDGYNESFASLDENVKLTVSHRAFACAKLKEFLKEL